MFKIDEFSCNWPKHKIRKMAEFFINKNGSCASVVCENCLFYALQKSDKETLCHKLRISNGGINESFIGMAEKILKKLRFRKCFK